MNVIGKRFDFFLAQRGITGLNLPVDVAFGHVVEINQRDVPHAAARQRLGSPRTYTTHANNHCVHLGVQKAVRAVAIQAIKPAKTATQILGLWRTVHQRASKSTISTATSRVSSPRITSRFAVLPTPIASSAFDNCNTLATGFRSTAIIMSPTTPA